MKNIVPQAENSKLPELLKPRDVKNILGISMDKAYRLFHSNDFPRIVLGRSALYVSKAKFFQWLGYHVDL